MPMEKGHTAQTLSSASETTAADIEQKQRNEKTDTSVGMPTMQLRDDHGRSEFGDEEELLAEFLRVGQTIAEGERDPKPGEIAQCFRCGKFAVIGEDLQLRMPTADEQLAINTNAHLTESQIVWASYVGAHRR